MDNIITCLERHGKNSNALWRFPAENLERRLGELNAVSARYAMVLHKLGVAKGERVGLLLNNCSDYVGLLLAIWRLNAIAVPLRPKGSKQTRYEQHILYCDDVCDFKVVIYGEQSSEGIFRYWHNNKEKTAVPLSYFQDITATPINDAIYNYRRIEGNDIAVLQFSSGSTGNPKGVIVTHGMMMAQLQNILYNHIGSRRGWPIESLASWMPVNHDMGLFIGVLTPVYTGCDNILAPPAYYMRNPARWFQLLSDYRVDMTFTTNSVLASTLSMLRRLHKRDDIDLSTLHLYIGAEKVSPVIVRRCYETLAPLKLKNEHVHIGYGMAENALGAACTRTDIITRKRFTFTGPQQLQEVEARNSNTIELVALGTPDRFHDITIRDEQDNVLPELVLGEINIESPCVTPGYYNNPNITADKLCEGRLRTGDLGFYCQGELYFYARKDDMIVTAGRNIIPDDIETLVEELPFVRPTASCLIGMENRETGTAEINLLVEVRENADNDELRDYRNKIQAHVYENLDVMINRILFCVKGTVEKTSSGKKRRKVVQQRVAEGNIVTVGA
ncbi:MAG: AMP-binding protein [Gammaproteobacteria bacterium]